MLDLEQILNAGLLQPEAGWNMGSFGAIAEFHHVRDEAPPLVCAPLTQITARGGIKITRLEGVRPVAYEMLSPRSHRWSHAVSLCLPQADAMMNSRGVLTELGPDADALRDCDRDSILFDMGLAQPQVDFCIRTSDPELLGVLRAQAGRALMAPDNPAMGAILAAHPHRVALTRLGRVEVYQMIGGPDTGGVSPEGPHTHVLPKLLRAGRPHSANAPIPEGWMPCAGFHPENPVLGRLGEDKDFDRAAFDAFQTLLQAWGPQDYLAAKTACWEGLARGDTPDVISPPATRTGRAGLRNALRQWHRLHGRTALSDAWCDAFDANAVPEEAEEESPGH